MDNFQNTIETSVLVENFHPSSKTSIPTIPVLPFLTNITNGSSVDWLRSYYGLLLAAVARLIGVVTLSLCFVACCVGCSVDWLRSCFGLLLGLSVAFLLRLSPGFSVEW